VDLSEPFVDAARYLTERTGQSGQVTFQCASALDLPFDDGRFDAVFLQHVAMNIADRMRLYGEIRRVLNAGGRFATYDVVLLSGAPHYPVPWARTPDTSFLLSAPATRAAIESSGFHTLAWQDEPTPPGSGPGSYALWASCPRSTSASLWGRTSHSLQPTWLEIFWKGGLEF
jgi:sarcosine/dimethylglycine N-methyltransferase